jgi:hypothetical protein
MECIRPVLLPNVPRSFYKALMDFNEPEDAMPKPRKTNIPADVQSKIASLPPRSPTAPRMVDVNDLMASKAANAAICSKLFSPKARKKA